MYAQDHQINHLSKESFLFSRPGHSDVRGSLRTRDSALYNSLWSCTFRLDIGRSHRAMALTAPSRPTCSSRSRGSTSAGVSRTTTASARTSSYRSRRSRWTAFAFASAIALAFAFASALAFCSNYPRLCLFCKRLSTGLLESQWNIPLSASAPKVLKVPERVLPLIASIHPAQHRFRSGEFFIPDTVQVQGETLVVPYMLRPSVKIGSTHLAFFTEIFLDISKCEE